jgi:FKBP-type peptidyl-prolyl cis-trans isomerase FkpA
MLRSAALCLSFCLALGCTNRYKPPTIDGPKPFGPDALLVFEPASNLRGVDPSALDQPLQRAATEQAKALKVIPREELEKVIKANGLSWPPVDRTGFFVASFVKALGAGYGLFGVVDKAETLGPGMMLALVNNTGDRSGEWMRGGVDELVAKLPRQVGALLQDLGATPTDPVKYSSGLTLEVLETGKGNRPRSSDRVKVNYEGRLPDGTVFDSTAKRGEPAVFGLDRVIACWNEAMTKLRPGAKAKMECPPSIAYGERGQPPTIPPSATLRFEVELLSIEK